MTTLIQKPAFIVTRDTKLDRRLTYVPVIKRKIKAIVEDEKLNRFVETGRWQW